ncbi:unnamed protein product [Pleuronectes platessa]|uniref:Uncharacterized protein n=1 Tax=Pleuronectes platessa TaxID=8262 RepID=A0A9N7VEX3_PLEPL|nr:unnamed protein product [Pleuronectes platessa]
MDVGVAELLSHFSVSELPLLFLLLLLLIITTLHCASLLFRGAAVNLCVQPPNPFPPIPPPPCSQCLKFEVNFTSSSRALTREKLCFLCFPSGLEEPELLTNQRHGDHGCCSGPRETV